MRHIATLIGAIFIGPLAWILIAFGQDRSTAAFARVQSTGAFHTGDFVRPLVYLAAAGVLVGLIATLRFSPLGAVLTGVVYVLSYVWLLVDPNWLLHLFRRNLSVFGQTADPTLPVRSGTTLIVGSLLVVSVLSAKRWRRWPRPVVAGAPEPAPEPIGYSLDHLGFGDEPDALVNEFAGPPSPRTAPPRESVQPAPGRFVPPMPPQAARLRVEQAPPVDQARREEPTADLSVPPAPTAPTLSTPASSTPAPSTPAPPAPSTPPAPSSAPEPAGQPRPAGQPDQPAVPAQLGSIAAALSAPAPAPAADPGASVAPVESTPAPSSGDSAATGPVRKQPTEDAQAPVATAVAAATQRPSAQLPSPEPTVTEPPSAEPPSTPARSTQPEPPRDEPAWAGSTGDEATESPPEPSSHANALAGGVQEPAAASTPEPASGQDEPGATFTPDEPARTSARDEPVASTRDETVAARDEPARTTPAANDDPATATATGGTATDGTATGGPADEPSARTGSEPEKPFDRWAAVESQAPRLNPTRTPPAGSPWATPLRDASEDPPR